MFEAGILTRHRLTSVGVYLIVLYVSWNRFATEMGKKSEAECEQAPL